MLKKDYPKGIVFYDGPSLIDGKPIVGIATGFRNSNNAKTGKMLQTWIIRKDIHPQEAKRKHEDFSVCGDCKHREFNSCYVHMHRGLCSIYGAYKRGNYKTFKPDDLKFFKDKFLRIGSYGDPAAIPFEIWENICKVTIGHLGYTHQWRKCDKRFKSILMASVDSIDGYYSEYEQAQSEEWRTFRIRCSEKEPVFENEFICPASAEAGKKTDCRHCQACCGVSLRKNPVIVVHGFEHQIRYYIEGMKKIKNKKKWRILPKNAVKVKKFQKVKNLVA